MIPIASTVLQFQNEGAVTFLHRGHAIYTAGQKFASLAAVNPPQFYENRFVKYTYSLRP